MRENIKQIIVAIVIAVVGIVGGFIGGTTIDIKNDGEKTTVKVENTYTMELPEAEVIETEDGEIEVIGAQTVEAVDSMNSTALTAVLP